MQLMPSATAVTVEIKEGGITFMRIADNGIGIDKEDVRAAFLRHSTSKIQSAEGLCTHYLLVSVVKHFPCCRSHR